MKPCAALLALALSLAGGLPAAAQAVVRIGLSAPLTGPDAAFGQGLRLGADQAVADLNRAGSRRFALLALDDAGDPRQAVTVAGRMAAEGVAAVVGPFESAAASAAAPFYEKSGTVTLSPGATYGPLTGRGLWNVFRLGPSDTQQARSAADFLARTFANRPIALVSDRTSFGRGLADDVARRLRELGRREAVIDSFEGGTTDLGPLVRRLAGAQVAAVYFGGLAPEAAALVRAMRQARLDATLVAGDGILDPAFAALGAPGEGTVMTTAPDAPKLPERGGKPSPRSPEAEAVAAQAYAAVQIIAQALDRGAGPDPRSGRVEGRKLAEALRSRPFRTVLGAVGFDARGDRSDEVVILKVWRRQPDGRLDVVGQDAPSEPGTANSVDSGPN